MYKVRVLQPCVGSAARSVSRLIVAKGSLRSVLHHILR